MQVLSEVPSPSELKAIYLEHVLHQHEAPCKRLFRSPRLSFVPSLPLEMHGLRRSVGCAHLAIPFSEPNLQDRLGAAVAYVIGNMRHKAHVGRKS